MDIVAALGFCASERHATHLLHSGKAPCPDPAFILQPCPYPEPAWPRPPADNGFSHSSASLIEPTPKTLLTKYRGARIPPVRQSLGGGGCLSIPLTRHGSSPLFYRLPPQTRRSSPFTLRLRKKAHQLPPAQKHRLYFLPNILVPSASPVHQGFPVLRSLE